MWDVAWLEQRYPLHTHQHDLVGMSYVDGDRIILQDDGTRRRISTSAWTFQTQRAGVTHYEEGVGEPPMRSVQIELKSPGPRAATVAASESLRQLFGRPAAENARAVVFLLRSGSLLDLTRALISVGARTPLPALTPRERPATRMHLDGRRECWLHGPNFSDGALHNLGLGWDAPSQRYADEGRATISRRAGDRGAFKTPTLREVARHPPYMHDGSLRTLRDVVLFYKRGGIRNPHIDTQIRPLHITPRDVDALVDFLTALNGEGFMDHAPSVFPQ